MKKIIKKLQKELSELSSKVEKLEYFIVTEEFKDISVTQQTLLHLQWHGMKVYMYALEERIIDLNK